MPISKSQGTSAKGPPRPSADHLDGLEVLTLAEAAAYLRVSEEDIVRLVSEQGLPGRRIGHEWRFLKAGLQEWLRTPSPPGKPVEELMQWAGAFRDDPDLQEIVEEAYRQRGSAMTKEGE